MGDREAEILQLACVTKRDIAEAIGVPHTTVRNWSAGRIEIPAKSRRDLATFLRAHAKRLERAAKELEG
jgi:DNA-binding transcriptional regulator YiaG